MTVFQALRQKPRNVTWEVCAVDRLEPLASHLLDLGFRMVDLGGVEFIEAPVCRVSAGAFTMGSEPQSEERGRASSLEAPQHVIDLDAFDMARFPVTVAEYARGERRSDA